MSPLTFAEKRENRLQYAFITEKELVQLKVKELRFLASQCGIQRGKMKKAELIAFIQKDLEAERLELASQEVKASQEELAARENYLRAAEDGDLSLKYVSGVKSVAHKLWDGEKRMLGAGEIQALAIEFTTELDMLYQSPSTKYTQLGKLCSTMHRMLGDETGEWADNYQYWFNLFKASAYANGKPWKKATNKNYHQAIFERKSNKRALNIVALLSKTKAILSNPEEFKWQDVACALLFATGRRAVEIMSLATFTRSEGYSVTFFGRAKTKLSQGGTAHLQELKIPTVVPGEQILAAMTHIQQKRVMPENTTLYAYQDAAKVFHGGGLSRALQRNIPKFMEEVEGKFKLKDLRVIYAQYMFALNNPNEEIMDKDLYISKIMGHSEGDITTKKAYDADFRVVL